MDMSSSSADLQNQAANRRLALRDEVEQVLNLIRTAVQSDGGDVELVGVTAGGVVEVRFHGACVGCPEKEVTLRTMIERTLKQRVPGVSAVQAVA
jgi:Fe-S cluster biogenesis protein NfuA